ncbi:MAG TPA: hypothetical protein VIQ31_33910, partial [Phormidium sp.]
MPGQAPFTLRTPADPTRAIKPIHYVMDFQNKQGVGLDKAYDERGILRPVDLRTAGDIFYQYIDGQDVTLRNQIMDEMDRRFRGLSWKPSADIAIRDAAVTPGQLMAGATFQGFALVPGSRVLLATGATDSYIYEVQATGAAMIAPDSTLANLSPSDSVRIQEGTFAERLFVLENNTDPVGGDILNWQPQAVPVQTQAGAGIGYDAMSNSYFIRNDDGSITIDPDGVRVSAAYTNDMVDRINAAVAPLITRISALEGLTQQHTTQIAGLESAVAQIRQQITALDGRVTSAEGRLTGAETDIDNLQALDWTVPFPSPAAAVTNPDATTTLVTIDLTKARWFASMGLTYDILDSLAYVANTGGGVRQIEAPNGLIISADGRTG